MLLQGFSFPFLFKDVQTNIHKMLGQHQHPHSCSGKFTKMLNMGTFFFYIINPKHSYLPHPLVFLFPCMWQTHGRNTNGLTDSKTDIYLFTRLKVCVRVPNPNPHLPWQECVLFFLVSVTNRGPQLCDGGGGNQDHLACIIHEEWECQAVIWCLPSPQSYSQNVKLCTSLYLSRGGSNILHVLTLL